MALVEVEIDGQRALIERDRLEVRDVFAGEDDNSRATATEWYLDGKMVRRDCAVSILRTEAIGGQQQAWPLSRTEVEGGQPIG